ncbi:MAG: hypothetical protein ACHQFZ_00150 [Acidimicrobiales bacterium]
MKRALIGLAAGSVALGMFLSSAAIQATADTTTTTTPPPSTTTTLAPPVQGNGPLPIAFQVDTVTSGASGILKYGCAQTNEFYVGSTVVFRMYAENVADGGTVLTAANTASVTLNIPGLAAIPMNYGNHGSIAFWSYGWKTTGYATGIVNFSITVVTAKVDAVTKTVAATKYVVLRIKGKPQYKNHKLVYVAVPFTKTVVVTPAVPGVTGTFTQAGFAPGSMLTINPVPLS